MKNVLMWQRIKRRLFKYWPALRVGLLGGVLIGVLLGGYLFVWPLMAVVSQLLGGPGQILATILPSPPRVESFRGRTNILLLGAGGAGHEAPDLTDSLIVISLPNGVNGNLAGPNEIILLSVPRDIWVSSMKAKINTAYYYGEQKQPGGGGLVLARASVEEILDTPIHYVVKVNFAAFEKVIDLFGGVEMTVGRSFVDRKYPLAGKENDLCGGDPSFSCRYETVEFKKGRQLMDGKTALKFVRSRNAEGEEGTDFARSVRQQQFLMAVKEKVLKLKNLLDLSKVRRVVLTVREGVATNIEEEKIDDFFKLGLKIKDLPLRSLSLTGKTTENGTDWGLFYNPPVWQYAGQWVLVPKNDDWEIIHRFVKCEFYGEC